MLPLLKPFCVMSTGSQNGVFNIWFGSVLTQTEKAPPQDDSFWNNTFPLAAKNRRPLRGGKSTASKHPPEMPLPLTIRKYFASKPFSKTNFFLSAGSSERV